MNMNKIFGGFVILIGLLMLICIIPSYYDGYKDWWHFIPLSVLNLGVGRAIYDTYR